MKRKISSCFILFVVFITSFTLFGNTHTAAIELIKSFEEFNPNVYVCAAGKESIGYGFTSHRLVSKKYISRNEADTEIYYICDDIIDKLHNELDDCILTEYEEIAVVSFIYNVGWYNFKTSTMCALLKQGFTGDIVAKEFGRWVYVTRNNKKIKSNGLMKRREIEARIFMFDCKYE